MYKLYTNSRKNNKQQSNYRIKVCSNETCSRNKVNVFSISSVTPRKGHKLVIKINNFKLFKLLTWLVNNHFFKVKLLKNYFLH